MSAAFTKTSLAMALIVTCAIAPAQGPRKIGEVYSTELLAVSDEAGQFSDVAIPATLTILKQNADGPPTTVTLQADVPSTVVLVKVPSGSVPAEFEALFGQSTVRYFNMNTFGMWGDSNFAGPGRGTATFTLAGESAGKPVGAASYDYLVLDGAGRPATGMTVEVLASLPGRESRRYPIGRSTLGKDGRFLFSLPETAQSSNPAMHGHNQSAQHQIVVTDPSNGQSQVVPIYQSGSKLILNAMRGEDSSREISTALIPADADVTAFRGKVMRSDGTPAADVSLSFYWLETPGKGGKQFQGEASMIRVGRDGRFSVGVPVHWLEQQLGQRVLPAQASLKVNVESVQTVLLTDRENVIELPHTEDLVFELRDENDQPIRELTKTVQERGGFHLVRMRQTSETLAFGGGRVGPVVDEARGRVAAPGVPLPATYQLEQSVGELRFQPQRLERGASANVIVWRVSRDFATVVGRVVSAETSAPLAGAYVLSAFDGGSAWALATMDAREREDIWNKWMEGKQDEVVKDGWIKTSSGRDIYQPIALTRTGVDGRFTLDHPPGKRAQGIRVFAPGHMAASGSLHELKPRPNLSSGRIELGDLALPKVAYTTVTVMTPAIIPDPFLRADAQREPGSLGVSSGLTFDRTFWKAEIPGLNPEGNSPWRLLDSGSWASLGEPFLMHVPAEVKFDVTAACPNAVTLGYATWKDLGPLQPGEQLELPARPISIKRPFLIVVKNADGSPAVGVSARIDGNLPLTTDENGTAIGWTTGSVGRLEIYRDRGWKVVAEKRDFDVPEQQAGSEPFRVELTISDAGTSGAVSTSSREVSF